MSQIFKQTSGGGPLPPTVPTQFITDVKDNTTTGPGKAVPSSNTLQLLGGSTDQDNVNGIRTDANPNNGNIAYTELTNRIVGSGTSTNASTVNLATFALGSSATVYRFRFDIAGRDTGSGDGVGYDLQGTVKTDGATATLISVPYLDEDEDASLLTASVTLAVTGNSVIVQVIGVSGRTINYKTVGYYVGV
jgi:hypothetical protein